MTYSFSDRLDYLGTRMKDLHDNEITYIREPSSGSIESITIENVTPEQTDSELLQALGVAFLQEKWQDLVFDASELSSLDPSEPKAGDRIEWGSNTFQVVAINDEIFVYTTSSRERIRVHTKQIA